MRLWTLHPKYLDRQGLLAVWREGLLAQAVLAGKTKGYRNHPQLERFKAAPNPLRAIGSYLREVQAEATQRGYRFDLSKILATSPHQAITETSGQIKFERSHLLQKLKLRSEADHDRLNRQGRVFPHPLFSIIEGNIAPWEKGRG